MARPPIYPMPSTAAPSSSHCTARLTICWSAIRFTGKGELPKTLDQILHADFASLRAERRVEDERISRYVESLTEADLSRAIRYRTFSKPTDIEQVLAPALDHFFNHQTHHRGQAHTMLSAVLGNDATPSFDLIIYQRETGQGGLRTLS